MAIWLETIDVSRYFRDNVAFEDARDGIVEALKASNWYKTYRENPSEPSLIICVDELAAAETVEDFDYYWDLLYHLADRDRIWIDTIGLVRK